ncbi:hypothetical protein FNV43_RR27356 [Rhamnella rubrinervis]|uniref:Elongator complex protein 5 n=1 Tax=Rhamnella rubrinervis TaxID=2594499 RepID=A0A8K0DPT8_9ROSA|nr:hypothetical protein FNV43_RR27356 [Rhamnella rubrinervis]
MTESICRALRDGALEGEHAPALTIKDSIASPFGFDVFVHVLFKLASNILAGKYQSRGLVLIAFHHSPSFYVDLLKRKGVDFASSHKWIQILDCYTDPLGWKDGLGECGSGPKLLLEASYKTCLCKNVKDVEKLFSTVIELGKGLVGQSKDRFCVAIDSLSEMLRYASVSSVAGFLSKLRSQDQVSSIFWLLRSDLHEVRVTSAFEYMSSIVASLNPFNQCTNGHKGSWKSLSLLEQNSTRGKIFARFKRRNGRVRVACEEFHVEQSGINLASFSSEDGKSNQSLLPKLQFNLRLSEKERVDRAKVVLPFEHQGNGRPIEIYDGRRPHEDIKCEAAPISTGKSQTNEESSKGEIIYFRDSDDEMPDSDEDPDDDLDI